MHDDFMTRYIAHKEFVRDLIDYDNLEFLTHATVEEECGWALVAEGCFVCGRTQPDCEMLWEVDEEALITVSALLDSSQQFLTRPRRWFCAVDTQSGLPRAMCPSCYRLVKHDCSEGIWNAEFMEPYRHLQMILPFTEAEAAP